MRRHRVSIIGRDGHRKNSIPAFKEEKNNCAREKSLSKRKASPLVAIVGPPKRRGNVPLFNPI